MPPAPQPGEEAGVVQAIEAAAERLGNTVAVCRKSYVHPAVLEAYSDGEVIAPVRRRPRGPGRLTGDEAAVARLIERRTRAGRKAMKKVA